MASFPPTTTTTTCVPTYRSVTLAAGEQFNLPPGAELFATSDISAISSTCPIPVLTSYARYCFRIVIQNDASNRTEPWQNTAVGSSGIFIGEQFFGFASGDGAAGDYYAIQGGLQTWLTRIPGLVGVFRNTCVSTYSDRDYGDGCMTCFDAPISIAEILSLDYGTQDFTGTATYINTKIEARPAGYWPDGC